MSDEPMLSGALKADDAPMLGGERAVMVPCPLCGGDTIRDFFGNWVCLDCIAKRKEYKAIAENGTCTKCKRVGWLEVFPSLDRQGRDELSIYCQDCETDIFRALVSTLEGLGPVWQCEEFKEWQHDRITDYMDTWDSWDRPSRPDWDGRQD